MRIIEADAIQNALTSKEVIMILLNRLYQAGIVVRVLDENNRPL